jgi:hypothetical protein
MCDGLQSDTHATQKHTIQSDFLARGPTEVYLQILVFNEFVNQLTDYEL